MASFDVASADAQGKVIALGMRTTETPTATLRHALVRYDAQGRRDSSFGTGGIVLEDVPASNLTQGGYLQSIPTVVVVRTYEPGSTMLSRYWR